MAKLGYQNSKTPEPIVTKFGVGDDVGDMTQRAKIQTDRPSGDVPVYGWNITLALFLDFCFFACVPRLNRRTHFYAVWFIRCQSRVIAFLER